MDPVAHQIRALRISGADARDFLQGQLTQDMDQVRPERPMVAGWANPKGRLLCVCAVFEWQDAIWLLLPDTLLDAVQKRLSLFILRARVSIDAPEGYAVIDDSSKEDPISYCLERGNSLRFRFEHGPAMAFHPGDGEPANPSDNIARWRAAHVLAGIPTLWPTTVETFVPQMLNLDLLAAISFSKGCYVGQEIVARTQNLGRIKRRMYGFEGTSAAACMPGDKLYVGESESGQIVDAAATTATGCRVLAVVPIAQADNNFSLGRNGEHPLTRVALPYAVPDSLG